MKNSSNTFTIDISKWAEKTRARMADVVREASIEVAARVTDRTPVASGRAKTNWNYGDGRPDTSTTEGTNWAARAAALAEKIRNHDPATPIYITNSLPYIRRLEYGWSKQAPSGMVRLTAAEWQGIAKRAVEKAKRGGK